MKTLRVLGIITLLAVFIFIPIKALSSTQNFYWNVIDQGYGSKISMLSENNGWRVLLDGLPDAYLYHWDGSSWIDAGTVSHTTDILRGDIAMTSSSDGWLVLGGPLGGSATVSRIYRWNGTSWNLYGTYSSPPEVSMASIDMLSATDGWIAAASGVQTYFYHWNGSIWEQPYFTAGGLYVDNDVDMVSTADGWAVGFLGQIAHWNGANWLEITSPVTISLNSISMLSTTDGWIVGNNGVILRWDGNTWNAVNSPTSVDLYSVAAVSATNGWAVGDQGVILHWNGNAWTQISSPANVELYDIQMLSSSQGWITGYGANLQYINATLSINYSTGAPGSYFTITGENFPASSNVEIYINGRNYGTVQSDPDGNFSFLLTTDSADEGAYFIEAEVNPYSVVRFDLSASAPVRPQAGSGPLIDVPAGYALNSLIHAPFVMK